MLLQAFGWLQAMLRISLAPALPHGADLPQILCYDELETMDTMMWLGMQNVIIVNDRCSPHLLSASCLWDDQYRMAPVQWAGLLVLLPVSKVALLSALRVLD